MKNNDLLKLALGAGAGYLATSIVLPKGRGFAGYTCDGHPCENIPCSQVWHCQQQCHWDNDYTQTLFQKCSNMHQDVIYRPDDARQQGAQTYENALKSTGDAFNSSLQFLKDKVGMPMLIVGGLVLAIVLVTK